MLRRTVILIAATVFVAALAWPAAALMMSAIEQAQPPREGFLFSSSQFVLLARTFLLAAAAAGGCTALGIVAGVWGLTTSPRPCVIAALAAGLTCPPMIYSFGWLRILPTGLPAEIRCIIGWVVWAWPVAAVIIAAGWARLGAAPYESATLCARPAHAFFHVGLPALKPYILLASLLLFVLFFGDYGMPHGFGLHVYATELLAWSSQSERTIDVLWPAILPIAITSLALTGLLACTRAHLAGDLAHRMGVEDWSVRRGVLLVLMVAGWALPLAALSKPLTRTAMAQTWKTYAGDLGASIAVAASAALLIAILGLGFVLARRPHVPILFFALVMGALPGAVVAESMIAAYNREATRWIYDYWPVVSLAYVARYAWIGLLGCLLIDASPRDALDQARTDGASESQIITFILWPHFAPLFVGLGAVVIALAIADVAATTPIRVPQYHPVGILIIDKFHQFQDGMLISLSLVLVAVCAAAGFLVAWARQRIMGSNK